MLLHYHMKSKVCLPHYLDRGYGDVICLMMRASFQRSRSDRRNLICVKHTPADKHDLDLADHTDHTNAGVYLSRNRDNSMRVVRKEETAAISSRDKNEGAYRSGRGGREMSLLGDCPRIRGRTRIGRGRKI